MSQEKRASRPAALEDGGPKSRIEDHLTEPIAEAEGKQPPDTGQCGTDLYEVDQDGITYKKLKLNLKIPASKFTEQAMKH